MDYPQENDLRLVTRADRCERQIQVFLSGAWVPLPMLEVISTRMENGGSAVRLTLSVHLPCIITMRDAWPEEGWFYGQLPQPDTETSLEDRLSRPSHAPGGVGTYPIARTRADLDACSALVGRGSLPAETPSFNADAAALAQEIVRDHAEPCAIVIEEDRSPVGVASADAEELKPSATEGVPFVRTQQASAVLPGDELIEARGGRYPAKRGR